MTFTLNAGQKSVSIQFTDSEWSALAYARTTYGAGVMQDLMKNWLRHVWRQGEDARLKGLENAVPPDLA